MHTTIAKLLINTEEGKVFGVTVDLILGQLELQRNPSTGLNLVEWGAGRAFTEEVEF